MPPYLPILLLPCQVAHYFIEWGIPMRSDIFNPDLKMKIAILNGVRNPEYFLSTFGIICVKMQPIGKNLRRLMMKWKSRSRFEIRIPKSKKSPFYYFVSKSMINNLLTYAWTREEKCESGKAKMFFFSHPISRLPVKPTTVLDPLWHNALSRTPAVCICCNMP